MRRTLLMSWLACFAGTMAMATGILGTAGHGSPWKDATASELTTAWSRVSPDALDKLGGVSTSGTKTEQSNYAVCQTGICRSVGGHGYICTDYGTKLVNTTFGFSYVKSATVTCGNEIMYSFTNCTGYVGPDGACAAGTLTYTDFFDP